MTREELIEEVVNFYLAKRMHDAAKRVAAEKEHPPAPEWRDDMPLPPKPKPPKRPEYKRKGNVVYLPKRKRPEPFDPRREPYPF